MSAPAASAPPTAASRRLRFGVMAAVIAACATVSAALVTVLCARHSARIDVTATGEFRLSPRTTAVLSALAGEWEIVLAADPRAGDGEARRRVRDVLAEMRRRAPGLRVTWLDVGDASGAAAYTALLDRLRDRDAALREQAATLRAGIDAMEAVASYFGAPLAEALRAAAAQVTADDAEDRNLRAFLIGNADAARAESARLGEAVRAARAALDAGDAPGRIAPADEVGRSLAGHLRPMTEAVGTLARELGGLAAAESVPPAARAGLAGPAAELARQRDRLAHHLDAAERLRPTDLVKARRLLESTSAAVVIGPAGLTAVDGAQLFPPTAEIDAAAGLRADLGRRAEDLLSTALSAVVTPVKPVVVLVHAEPAAGVLESPVFRDAIDRLAVRGMEVVEWAAAIDDAPPALARAGPDDPRPVVYIVHSTDASSGPPNAPTLAGPARAARLGAAVSRLIDGGESVLLSLNPWSLSRIGEADPTAARLPSLGIEADTGRPLIREATGPAGLPVVVRWHELRCEPSPHPLSGAISGLPTLFPWPVALRLSPGSAGATLTPLFIVRDTGAWGESQWLNLWQAPADPPARSANAPAPDAQRDAVDRPWTVACAVERPGPSPGGRRTQRLVIVGANGWFARGITAAGLRPIDGRVAARYPGNLELLEAAAYWLAGRDEMIARTPAAASVPRVRHLTGREVAAVRWVVAGAMPLLTLAAGLVWRMLRG